MHVLQLTVRDALNSALDEEMTRDPLVYILGEEVRFVVKLLCCSSACGTHHGSCNSLDCSGAAATAGVLQPDDMLFHCKSRLEALNRNMPC